MDTSNSNQPEKPGIPVERRGGHTRIHRDDDGSHWISGTYRVVNAAFALMSVLLAVFGTVIGGMWFAMEYRVGPLIDQKIKEHDVAIEDKADRALGFAIEHRVEAQAAMRDFSDYKERNSEDLRRIYDELRYIRETLDGRRSSRPAQNRQ